MSPSTEEIQGIIYKEALDKQLDEADKNSSELYRKHYDAKIVALKLEEMNNSKLILFPSVNKNEDDEWYKMGGNSALFYKNIVGPRLGRKDVKIRKDADMNHRFKGGVVAVHWKKRFIVRMIEAGYEEFEENELGMLFFDLGNKFTVEEIERYRTKEKREAEKLNRIITLKNSFPDLYGLYLQLARLLPLKLKRMNPVYREMFQAELIDNYGKIFVEQW